MSHGKMSLSNSFLEFFCSNVKEGSTVLEFGSGEGTKKLVERGYNVYSIEENKTFVGNHHDNYFHAKIVDDWYDLSVVRSVLENVKYDVILIDGPAAGDRRGFLKVLEFIDTTVPIFVDDIERQQDRELFTVLSENKICEDKKYYGLIK